MFHTSTLLVLAAASLAGRAAAFAPGAGAARAQASRVPAAARVLAGLFDATKDAFKNPRAPQEEDRITPIDRWLGIDKAVGAAPVSKFVDPRAQENYRLFSLAKPMGIKFIENEDGKGIAVEELVATGSAAAGGVDVLPGDQLVAVDGEMVLGYDFDAALGTIMNSSADTVKLSLFRGPAQFLYGPTRPSTEWLREHAL